MMANSVSTAAEVITFQFSCSKRNARVAKRNALRVVSLPVLSMCHVDSGDDDVNDVVVADVGSGSMGNNGRSRVILRRRCVNGS